MTQNKFEVSAQEFLLNVSPKDGVFSDTFIYEPINIEEEKLGNLYMLGHISLEGEYQEKNIYVINYLASLVKKEYYGNTKRTVAKAMETSIKRANDFLNQGLNDGNTNLVNLNFGIFIVSPDGYLHFSHIGDMKVGLMRGSEIFDLSEKISGGSAGSKFSSFFSKIARGKIENSDFIIISTESLYKVLLGKIQNGFSPNLFFDKTRRQSIFAAEVFQQISGVSLLLKIQERRDKKNKNEEEEEQKLLINFRRPGSLEKLGASIPVASRGALEYSKKWSSAAAEIALRYGKSAARTLYEIAKKEGKKLLSLIAARLRKTKMPNINIFININADKALAPITQTSKAISDMLPDRIKKPLQSIQKILTEFLNRIPVSKSSAAERRKKIIIASAALILILMISGGVVLQLRMNETKKTEIQKTISQIENRMTQADSYLIAGDEKFALNQLKDARNLLAAISDSGFFKERITTLNGSLTEKLNKMNKMSVIEPALVATIGPFDLNFNPKKIMGYANKNGELEIYFFDPLSSLLYQYQTGAKEGKFLLGVKEKFDFAMPFGDTKDKIAFLAQKNILIFNPADKSFAENPFEEDSRVNDFSVFNNNIYLLTDGGKVLKGAVKNDPDGQPIKLSSWLAKNSRQVNDAKTFAIDGNIYFLLADGIAKFSAGKFVKILETNIFPEINQASKIYTAKNFKFIYALDSRNQRIIILDKNGDVAAQYQNEKFAGLTDLWINGDESKIYLLGGSNLYEIPRP